jgi:hypothetical protein
MVVRQNACQVRSWKSRPNGFDGPMHQARQFIGCFGAAIVVRALLGDVQQRCLQVGAANGRWAFAPGGKTVTGLVSGDGPEPAAERALSAIALEPPNARGDGAEDLLDHVLAVDGGNTPPAAPMIDQRSIELGESAPGVLILDLHPLQEARGGGAGRQVIVIGHNPQV